ncbi:MAG TPA: helix-turn-helix domain-containing protein [Candidatus Binataceae bacterium]|jgi:excisionase family DNA binding protein
MQSKDAVGEVMTVKDLSEYLHCNQSTIYRLLKRGELPAFKVGSDWRFMTAEIRNWCKKRMSSVKPRTNSRMRNAG